MFAARDSDVVFLETVMDTKRGRHTLVHVVPLSKDDGAMAPMYFKVRSCCCPKPGLCSRARVCVCVRGCCALLVPSPTTADTHTHTHTHTLSLSLVRSLSLVVLCFPFEQKAISESDTQWSQNKKLIDTRKKGIRRSVRSKATHWQTETVFGEREGSSDCLLLHMLCLHQ